MRQCDTCDRPGWANAPEKRALLALDLASVFGQELRALILKGPRAGRKDILLEHVGKESYMTLCPRCMLGQIRVHIISLKEQRFVPLLEIAGESEREVIDRYEPDLTAVAHTLPRLYEFVAAQQAAGTEALEAVREYVKNVLSEWGPLPHERGRW